MDILSSTPPPPFSREYYIFNHAQVCMQMKSPYCCQSLYLCMLSPSRSPYVISNDHLRKYVNRTLNILDFDKMTSLNKGTILCVAFTLFFVGVRLNSQRKVKKMWEQDSQHHETAAQLKCY